MIAAEPLAWLLALVCLYFGERRKRVPRAQMIPGNIRNEEPAMDYKPLGAFILLKITATLCYPLFSEQLIPLGISKPVGQTIYVTVYWLSYLLSTVVVFSVMGALLRQSLRPLPGLSSAALILFRWAAILTLIIALTAHIPIFGFHGLANWLDEVSISFMLCVCSFELTLTTMLFLRLEKLGMCLRSRPVGIGMGLTLMGLADLISGITINLASKTATDTISCVYEVIIYSALVLWCFYIILPEPRRSAHSLSPASKLMRWNEIALKLEVNGRQSEQTPFISGVQLIVDGILDKYNIGKY